MLFHRADAPPPSQQSVRGRRPRGPRAPAYGLEALEPRDLRLELAAAHALAGDLDEAGRRLAALPPAPRRPRRISPLPAESTVRVVGAGMPLGALRSRRRIVLLGEPADGQDSDPLAIELLAFDAARSRAVVAWSTWGSGWGGDTGRYLFARASEGEWRLVGGEEHRGCFAFSVLPESEESRSE